MATNYTFTAGDLATVTGTAQGAADKYTTIYGGERTALLEDLESSLQTISGKTALTVDVSDTWHTKWWDMANVYYVTGYDITDATNAAALMDRFSLFQLTSGGAASNYVLSDPWKTFVEDNDAPLVLYWNFYTTALANALSSASSPEYVGTFRNQYWGTALMVNPANGDAIDLGIKGQLIDIANYVKNIPTLVGLLAKSEEDAAIMAGDVANAAAANDGIDSLTLWPSATGAADTAIVEDDDETFLSLSWHYARRSWKAHLAMLGEIAHAAWPEFKLSFDPIYELGCFSGCDHAECWYLTMSAFAHLQSAWHVERIRAHNRIEEATSRRILVGPHIAEPWTYGGTTYSRGASPDVFSAGCWLSLAMGSHGTTHWGWAYFRDWTTGELNTNGAEVWETLRQFREIGDDHQTLLMNWAPKQRRMAIYVSTTDEMYEHGRNSTTFATPYSKCRYWIGSASAAWTYYACLGLGEPLDWLYTPDIADGVPSNYECIIVPCAYYISRSELTALQAFVDGGGTVMCSHDSVLVTELDGVTALDGTYAEAGYSSYDEDLSSLAPYYSSASTAGMTGEEFRLFLAALQADIANKLPFTPAVNLGSSELIANVMEYGDDEYLVLVNNHFRAGADNVWWNGISGYDALTDESTDETVTLDWGGANVVDIISNESFVSGETITIEAGWGRVLRRVVVPSDSIGRPSESNRTLPKAAESSTTIGKAATSSTSLNRAAEASTTLRKPVA